MDEGHINAKKALTQYLTDNPGSTPSQILGHFFPEPDHGFSQRDLSGAFVNMMSDGEIEEDNHWRMTLTNPKEEY